ncbi:exosortase-associated EpsI family protein, partial [Petrachloros mirabilis]
MRYRRSFQIRSGLRDTIIPLAMAFFSLAIGPLLAWWYQVGGQAADVTVRLVLPDRIGNWHSASKIRGAWRPEILGADSVDSKIYTKVGTGPVELYAFYYYQQRQGKEAISDMNRIADGKV